MMSEIPTDPDKPTHVIVGRRDDGSPLRNDGKQLQPANQNPWYVLATVYGEQAADAKPWNFDKKLAVKNRDAWNLWYCHGLDDDALKDRAEKVGLKPEELVPFKDGARDTIEIEKRLTEIGKRVRKHLKAVGAKDINPPDATRMIIFSKTWFQKFSCFESYCFETFLECESACFQQDVSFRSTLFHGNSSRAAENLESGKEYTSCSFEGTEFLGAASFRFSRVIKDAEFRNTVFGGEALFRSFEVIDYAFFTNATFHQKADFRHSRFYGPCDFEGAVTKSGFLFNSVEFYSLTSFKNAQFLTCAPEFHAAELYDDTDFTLPDDFLKNWPPIQTKQRVQLEVLDENGNSKDPKEFKDKEPAEYKHPITGTVIMPAKQQKKAYNRLRLFMNKSLQIDEEQFFHRMEMRCKRAQATGLHKCIYTLYWALSDYGNSVKRPLTALALLITFGAAATLLHLEMDDPATGEKFATAVGWSVSTTLPFQQFGKLYYGAEFAKCLPQWLKIISGVQTIFGFILLFFLGLGLRNRFRLR